jgi:hypothetical protein
MPWGLSTHCMCLTIKVWDSHVPDRKLLERQAAVGVQREKSALLLPMPKNPPRLSSVNLSVEEENLAAIPFAVLERRVGKRLAKLEISGAKVLPDGREVRVTWQVRGNQELGLPTEQDLDIFVALGTLTFRNNFAKTVSFTGREIAKILNIGTVHGKFYQRLKLAMDRFIALSFRGVAESERQEEVKWLNVFQEASFSLDKESGRCVGTVTWTDKLIQSMDSGFFRLLNAGRYMELDGITAKHMYRFLAVAFEKTDLVIIDPRKLATEHLGIPKPPKYLSRLMQTLEPAFEQLQRIEVLGSYTVLSARDWRIALRRHPDYVPERKALSQGESQPLLTRDDCRALLVKAGLPMKTAGRYAEAAETVEDFLALERAARILEGFIENDVLPHVALNLFRNVLDIGSGSPEGLSLLDSYEIALEVCRMKRRAGQSLRNPGGLIVKMLQDPASWRRVVNEDLEQSLKEGFRRREQVRRRRDHEQQERVLILEYEEFRQTLAAQLLDEMPEAKRNALRKEKEESLRHQDRFHRLSTETQRREVDDLIRRDIAEKEVPGYERWRLRQLAEQAILPFAAAVNGDALTANVNA